MKYPAKRSRVVKTEDKFVTTIPTSASSDDPGIVVEIAQRICARCPEPITTRRVKETSEGLVHAACANEGAQ